VLSTTAEAIARNGAVAGEARSNNGSTPPARRRRRGVRRALVRCKVTLATAIREPAGLTHDIEAGILSARDCPMPHALLHTQAHRRPFRNDQLLAAVVVRLGASWCCVRTRVASEDDSVQVALPPRQRVTIGRCGWRQSAGTAHEGASEAVGELPTFVLISTCRIEFSRCARSAARRVNPYGHRGSALIHRVS
jgi:hypothetical protein